MGNHKVEMAEIEDFSTDLQEASEDIQSQLDQVKESIESINDMSSFSGKTATEAKKYFEEMHLTIIESFRGLFGDLEGNLNKHIQDFQTDVDASEKAKIESNYLQ
ncbi:MAG TPA: T7SS effector LXG polymorphic toxin, partial [Pseudogracilibacillus sp.]|nr:T7SS effector LXG polymorphic toxin [Pseudogracilibacillus sp.]